MPRLLVSQGKKEILTNPANLTLDLIAEKILPRVFLVYENNIQPQVRQRILQTIDKLISIFYQESQFSSFEPYSFAKFIISNMRTKQMSSIQLCLQMVSKLMEVQPKRYTLAFIREGVA